MKQNPSVESLNAAKKDLVLPEVVAVAVTSAMALIADLSGLYVVSVDEKTPRVSTK